MRTRRMILVVLALAMVATACGGDSTTDTSAGATDTTTGTTADAGGTADATRFVFANPFPIFDLDPASAFSTEHVVLQNVYESLTRFNPPGSAEQVSGVLAESWESNADATVWTFNLRPGVTFHDGAPLDADAVIASLNRTLDLGLGASFILFPIDSMEAVDDLTVQFNLAYPAPLDLVMSATYGAYIISPNAIEQDADWFGAGNDAGSGPYTISSYSPSENTVLTRYDDYWGGWSDGQIETIDIQLVEDPVLAEQMMRGGEADFTYNLPFDIYASLDAVDGLEVVRAQSMQNLFGLLNHERLSPEVREALVLSFPYDDVADNLYGGEGQRSMGIIPQAMWGSDPNLAVPDTDLDRAAAILSDAGVTDLSLTYSYDAGTTEQQQIGEVWSANLATIGVELILEPLTFDARWEIQKADPAAAADVFVMVWFPTFVTPYDFLFSLFRSEEEPFFNLGYYSNPDFDFLIDDADALSGTDRDGAIELFRQAQEMLVADSSAVFMIDIPDVNLISSSIDGYVPNPAYTNVVRFYDLTRTAG